MEYLLVISISPCRLHPCRAHLGAAVAHVGRVEEDDEGPLCPIRGELHLLTILVWQGNVWSSVSDFET